MKKQKILIGIIVVITAFIILCIASMTQIGQPVKKGKYLSGRDTYRAFGDGQIQILWTSKTDKILFDVKNEKELLSEIEKWGREKNNLFFVGKLTKEKTSLVLIIENKEIEEYADVDKISDIHKDAFEKLK